VIVLQHFELYVFWCIFEVLWVAFLVSFHGICEAFWWHFHVILAAVLWHVRLHFFGDTFDAFLGYVRGIFLCFFGGVFDMYLTV